MLRDEIARARKTRSYESLSLHLQEITWDELVDGGFVARIHDVHGFVFGALLSGLGRWQDVIKPSLVALRVHGAIEDALASAGFHNTSAMQTIIDAERLTFRFRDDDYGFDLDFGGDGRVSLTRIGSTLKTFHRWYTSFMPFVPDILRKAIAALNLELLRAMEGDSKANSTPMDEVPQQVRMLSAAFTFEVVCHNFTDPFDASREPKRFSNLHVMRENIALRLPDENGRIPKGDIAPVRDDPKNEALATYGRMDYQVSLNHRREPQVSQVMSVRAPSNSGWSGLFFTLSYVGENLGEARSGSQTALKPDYFLHPKACADAYISFFCDIGLNGFVNSVTSGFEFETTAASLA